MTHATAAITPQHPSGISDIFGSANNLPTPSQLTEMGTTLDTLEREPDVHQLRTIIATIETWRRYSTAFLTQFPGKTAQNAPTVKLLTVYSQRALATLQKVSQSALTLTHQSLGMYVQSARPTPTLPPNAGSYFQSQLDRLEKAAHGNLGNITHDEAHALAQLAMDQKNDAALAGAIQSGLSWTELFEGRTLLIHVISKGFFLALKQLLTQQPDLSRKAGESFLHLAFSSADARVVTALISRIDPRIQNAQGATPLAAFVSYQAEHHTHPILTIESFLASIISKSSITLSGFQALLKQKYASISFDGLDPLELCYLFHQDDLTQELLRNCSRTQFEELYARLLAKYPHDSVRKFYASTFLLSPKAYELGGDLLQIPQTPPKTISSTHSRQSSGPITLALFEQFFQQMNWEAFSSAEILKEAGVSLPKKRFPIGTSDEIKTLMKQLGDLVARLQGKTIEKRSPLAEDLQTLTLRVTSLVSLLGKNLSVPGKIQCSSFCRTIQTFLNESSSAKPLSFDSTDGQLCYKSLQVCLDEALKSARQEEKTLCLSSLRKFINVVATKEPRKGTPPAGFPALATFYQFITNSLLHTAATLKIANDPSKMYYALKELMSASDQCGGRYYATSIDLYLRFCRGVEDVSTYLPMSIAEYRKLCFDGVVFHLYANNPHNANIYNRALYMLGQSLGIPGYKAAQEFDDPNNIPEFNATRIKDAFLQAYTAESLVHDWLLPQLNSDEKLRESYLKAHGNLIPKAWGTDRYTPIIQELSLCSDEAEKHKVLRRHDIEPRSHQTAQEALEEDRQHSYLQETVYNTSGQLRPEAIWLLLEQMTIVQSKVGVQPAGWQQFVEGASGAWNACAKFLI